MASRYQLIWYNYIAQETRVDYIIAEDEDDANEIAIMHMAMYVGKDKAEDALESLSECDKFYDITRQSVEAYWKKKEGK